MRKKEIISGAGEYSERSFMDKLKRFGVKAGKKITEPALAMFYCMKDPETPAKVKLLIMGALGYFILPTDLICDLSPLVGFTDDLTVLITTYNLVKAHLKPEHSEKAAMKVSEFIH